MEASARKRVMLDAAKAHIAAEQGHYRWPSCEEKRCSSVAIF
jgi:hypothetical protein